MAADIFFTDNRAWSTSSNFFGELVSLAIKKCTNENIRVYEILLEAGAIRCLGINLLENIDLQMALTELVKEVAQDKLVEMRSDPKTHPQDIDILLDLIQIAQEHLSELRKNL